MTPARSASVEEKGEGDWRDVFDVNALGPTLVTRAALNRLVGLLDGPENVPISYITPRFPVS